METKEIILNIIKKENNPLSKRQIAKMAGVSSPTASKYIDILEAEGKIIIERYGNINLVRHKDG